MLTHGEFDAIERQLSDDGSNATFTFPLVGRTVRIRLMQTYPPYVGVDYGDGRNCVFDLKSMRMTYVD